MTSRFALGRATMLYLLSLCAMLSLGASASPHPFFSDGTLSAGLLLFHHTDPLNLYVIYDEPDYSGEAYYNVEGIPAVRVWDDFSGDDLNLSRWRLSGSVDYAVENGYLKLRSTTSGRDARVESNYATDGLRLSWMARNYFDAEGSQLSFFGWNYRDDGGSLLWTSYGAYWNWKTYTGSLGAVDTKLPEHFYHYTYDGSSCAIYSDTVRRGTASCGDLPGAWNFKMNNRDSSRWLYVDYVLVYNYSEVYRAGSSEVNVLSEERGDFYVEGRLFHRKRVVQLSPSVPTGSVVLSTTGAAHLEVLGGGAIVEITKPEEGSFLPSPLEVEMVVNSSAPANVTLYVDDVPVNTWTDVVGNTTLAYTLDTTLGSHTITAVAATSAGEARDSVNVVVILGNITLPPPTSGGGTSVSYRRIAEEVWSYRERTLTELNLSALATLQEALTNSTNAFAGLLANLSERVGEVEGSTHALREEAAHQRTALANLSREVGALEGEVAGLRASLENLSQGNARLQQRVAELLPVKEEVEDLRALLARHDLFLYILLLLVVLNITLTAYLLWRMGR